MTSHPNPPELIITSINYTYMFNSFSITVSTHINIKGKPRKVKMIKNIYQNEGKRATPT